MIEHKYHNFWLETYYGFCASAMSRLSQYRCGAIRETSPWNPALSLEQSGRSTDHFPLTVPGPRASARGETADRRHDAQWQWCAGYRPGPAGQFGHGHRCAQKKLGWQN